MLISQLIERLQKVLEAEGDITIVQSDGLSTYQPVRRFGNIINVESDEYYDDLFHWVEEDQPSDNTVRAYDLWPTTY
tara:strand:- start:118 stop:348 length:231 start_codon:yes stop_codon:yes gene_type:complete